MDKPPFCPPLTLPDISTASFNALRELALGAAPEAKAAAKAPDIRLEIHWNPVCWWKNHDDHVILEGSLEVKLPTIWTDAKQRWEE